MNGPNHLPEYFTKVLCKITGEVKEAREKWMQEEMEKRMPPSIFKCAKEKRHLRFVMRWISKHGYSWQESPGVVALMCNGKMVSAFKFVLKPK